MQLSASADRESALWDVAIDGRWLGSGPASVDPIEFEPFDRDPQGSARLLAVWLDNGETYSLAALRPANAKGQDRDAISVGLPDTRAQSSVFDPRLSTEYSAAGVPQRFGVELWLGDDPDGDQHPLRIAGEAPADSVPLVDGPLSVHPMSVHSAGVSGMGIYVLVR